MISIVFMVNWTRTWMFAPTQVERPAWRSGAQSPEPNDIGQTIEDAVASGLLRIGSGSARSSLQVRRSTGSAPSKRRIRYR